MNTNSASILLASTSSEGREQSEFWTIGSILHSIKSYSAKQIPQAMNHLGKVWQDGRYDRLIKNQNEFNNVWEYIKQNPAQANLVDRPEEYPFLWEIF